MRKTSPRYCAGLCRLALGRANAGLVVFPPRCARNLRQHLGARPNGRAKEKGWGSL
jgi:hypothetical protein